MLRSQGDASRMSCGMVTSVLRLMEAPLRARGRVEGGEWWVVGGGVVHLAPLRACGQVVGGGCGAFGAPARM